MVDVNVVLANRVYVEQDRLTPAVRCRLIGLASFRNPEFDSRQRLKYSVYGQPRVISRALDGERFLQVPRGCLESVLKALKAERFNPVLTDRRYAGVPLDATFRGELRPGQKLAVSELRKSDTGILAAGTAFGKTVVAAPARYVLGLSATVDRKDGQHPLIMMQCGPIRHRVDPKTLAMSEPFDHVVHVRPTSFRMPVDGVGPDGSLSFGVLCAALVEDAARNRQIVEDVLSVVSEGRSPVVLSDRREHVEVLARLLEGRVRHVVVLMVVWGLARCGRCASAWSACLTPSRALSWQRGLSSARGLTMRVSTRSSWPCRSRGKGG